MEAEFILDYIGMFRTGLIIGMLLAVSAGVGGLLIHYTARMFKMVGG